MRIKLRPKKGMIVRHPIPPYRALSEKGEVVPRNQYWGRRLKDGDVEQVTVSPKPISSPKRSDKNGKDKK